MAKDSLGDRMKDQYENRTRYLLPRRTYTIIRVDGKAFHSYTRGLKTPFDDELMSVMEYTALYLCKNLQGAKMAYLQSDEISVLLTDFEDISTQSWFDGNLQKTCSIAASFATAAFNSKASELLPQKSSKGILAMFDGRVFTIPDPIEVHNYFVWRQQDATRNSIQMLARSLYSHSEMHKKNVSDLQEMTFRKGHNWNDLTPNYKRGRVIRRDEENKWIVDKNIPIFTQELSYIRSFVPIISYEESK